MTSSSSYFNRAQEEAYLFNPAFCGALIFEFAREYQKAKDAPVAFPLPFCALSISLHPATRNQLPATTVNSLYSWIEEHGPALIGFQKRTLNLTPVIQEALRFAISHQALQITDSGEIAVGAKSASFTPTFLDSQTHETKECVRSSRQLGRWFAKAGPAATILSALGIKP